MTASEIHSELNLEAFLELPETEPASEFIDGKIFQKPFSDGEHSLLQGGVCTWINQGVEALKLAFAFPELLCIFGNVAIVPDVAVFRWDRIPRQASGRVANRFELHPDWAIEILSPEQKYSKVLKKLLHCSRYGTELGWLIALEDETITGVFPGQKIEVFEGKDILPVLEGLELTLTVEQILSWLVL